MWVRRPAGAIVAMAALVAVLAGCSSGRAIESGDNQGFVSGNGTAKVIAAGEREPAPDVSGTSIDGQPLALSDFAGDVVVLNVWGSWCAPCRAEAPALQQVSRDTKSQGVQFIGINTRDQVAAAQAFEDAFHIGYPSFDDQDGQIQLQFKDTIPPNAIPSTLVIDRNGQVAAGIVGPTTYRQLSQIVEQVAAEK